MSTLTGPESEFERLRASQSRRYLPAVLPACFPTVASTSPERPVADEKQRRIQVWLGSGSHARNAIKGFGLRSLALGFRFSGFRFQVSGFRFQVWIAPLIRRRWRPAALRPGSTRPHTQSLKNLKPR